MIEQQIIGCFLKDNTLITDSRLQPKHFEHKPFQIMLVESKKLVSEGKVVDQVTLLERIYDKLDEHNDIEYITNLEYYGDVNNFDSYEQELIDKYKKKATLETLQTHLSKGDQIELESLLNDISDIEEEHDNTDGHLTSVYMKLYELPYQDMTSEGIKSNIKAIDSMIGGFKKNDLNIIAGRPSMGKTAFMMKLVLESMNQGAIPIIFSLEMSEEALAQRLIAQYMDINSRYARYPQYLSDKQKANYQKAVAELNEIPHLVFDNKKTIPEMRTAIRKAKREYPDREFMVFIDYLQLMQTNEQFQREDLKIGYFSSQLKFMAKNFESPVICLSQLSRSVEQREDKMPKMSDLRESGNIEQDADVIMTLYRDAYYNKESEKKNVLDINIVKQREGATGIVPIYYKLESGKMGDLDDFNRITS